MILEKFTLGNEKFSEPLYESEHSIKKPLLFFEHHFYFFEHPFFYNIPLFFRNNHLKHSLYTLKLEDNPLVFSPPKIIEASTEAIQTYSEQLHVAYLR